MLGRLSSFLRNNLFLATLIRLFFVYVLFSLCRLAYYFYNIELFPSLSSAELVRIFWGGFQFDTVAILYVNVLFILGNTIPFKFRLLIGYQKVMSWIFLITNAIALAVNIADIPYYPFTFRRTTWDIFAQFGNEDNLWGLTFRFLLDYWYALVFFIGLIILLFWLYKKVSVDIAPKIKSNVGYYSLNSLAFLITLTLFIGGVRGGFKHSTRPITLSNASAFVNNPSETVLVLNTPFSLLKTLGHNGLEKKDYFTETVLDSIYTPLHTPSKTGVLQKKNVVVFILESFAKEYIGGLNRHSKIANYTGYTPFLDSLMDESLVFENAFANGKKSIEGLPSVLSSIPGMQIPYILTPYSYNDINSMPGLLRNEGYYTAFFHGAPNGSMGFDAYTKTARIESYFGKTEYNNNADFDGIWGIWDEPFFQFFANKMNTFQEPFCTSLFSISSHHPFKVPAKYEGKMKQGPLEIHHCINYSDMALRKFFKAASKMPWFKNTLFVITADHSVFPYYDEYNNSIDKFSVPIIFYTPDGSLKGRNDTTLAQQIDIMPTVLDYLNYNKPYVAFGKNLFEKKPTAESFAVNYVNDNYQYFLGDYVLIYDGIKVNGLYNAKTDRKLEHKINDKALEAKLLKQAKAFIQQYNNRMLENRLLAK